MINITAQSNGFVYEFAKIDYAVMAGYLIMLISIGFCMKKFCSNVKDFFIGGNSVSWWLAGTSCFMMSFSAWTFTGAAGFAYEYGILIILIFYFNVVAYLFVAGFIAHKCRQTRCVTYLQIVYERFGRGAEQFFTWIQIPMMLFGGAIWLMGLATFVSVAFGFPIEYIIIICGTVIIIYSTLAGSWAVMASDFMQSIILMILTIVVALLTVIKAGGMSEMISHIDVSKFTLLNGKHTIFWIIAYFVQIFMMFTSVTGAPKYLAVRNGSDARKAALLTGILFLAGPIMWFIPPIAGTIFYPDIAQALPNLTHAQDGAYVLVGLSVLPHGLAGLLIMVIFAATLSSMDGAINQNAAIICMNAYKPLLRPKASERELFIAARIVNVLLGAVVILVSIIFSRQKGLALFDLSVLLMSNIALPIAVPFFLIYWVKRTPYWSSPLSAVCGGIFSLLSKPVGLFDSPHRYISGLLNSYLSLGLDPKNDWPLSVVVFGVIIVSTGVFFASAIAWRWVREDIKDSIMVFYAKMNRPVDIKKENIPDINDQQFVITGTLLCIVGSCISAIALLPNAFKSRVIILITGLAVVLAGLLVKKLGKAYTVNKSLVKHGIAVEIISEQLK
jgi:Na+/proline symporter